MEGPPKEEAWDPMSEGDPEEEEAPPAEREAEEGALEEEDAGSNP
jgi:hypothetical protein